MRRTAGFTLLEVLGALVLLSLLLLGVYAGIRTATRSVRAGTATVERLDQVRSTQQLLRRELAQTMVAPIGHDANGDSVYFDGAAKRMRFVAPLPGYLDKLGPQLMALIDQCEIFLTNDSGPMHLASALGVPLVALFGSTSDVKTGPYNGGHIIHKHVSCSPCYRRTCPIDFRCMRSIEVDEVYWALLDRLAQSKKRRKSH